MNSAITAQLIIAVIGITGGGGLLWGLLKFKPERDSIISLASKQAVEATSSALTELREALHSTRKDLQVMRERELELLGRISRLEEALAAKDAIIAKLTGHRG